MTKLYSTLLYALDLHPFRMSVGLQATVTELFKVFFTLFR
jgi:hypothetical protein